MPSPLRDALDALEDAIEIIETEIDSDTLQGRLKHDVKRLHAIAFRLLRLPEAGWETPASPSRTPSMVDPLREALEALEFLLGLPQVRGYKRAEAKLEVLNRLKTLPIPIRADGGVDVYGADVDRGEPWDTPGWYYRDASDA